MKVLVSEEMRFFEEAFIALRTVVIAVLNVVSLLMINQIHFLEKLFLADIAAELWLLQVHLTVSEEPPCGLKHLSAVWTFLLGSFRSFRLWVCRVTVFVLYKALRAVELQVAFATNFSAVN